MAQEYEYGIQWKNPDLRDDEPHRTGMTYEQALAFMDDDNGAPDLAFLATAFEIIRRPIGEWETV